MSPKYHKKFNHTRYQLNFGTNMLLGMGLAAWLGWKLDKSLNIHTFPVCMFLFTIGANLIILFWFVKKMAHSKKHQESKDPTAHRHEA